MRTEQSIRPNKDKRFQIYIENEETGRRFRAACALTGSDINKVFNILAEEYADKLGIPKKGKNAQS